MLLKCKCLLYRYCIEIKRHSVLVFYVQQRWIPVFFFIFQFGVSWSDNEGHVVTVITLFFDCSVVLASRLPLFFSDSLFPGESETQEQNMRGGQVFEES